VSGAVFDGANKRSRFTKQTQNRLDDFNVTPLITRADVIDFARAPFLQREENGAAVIFNVNPIAHVTSVAVERNRLVAQRIGDHQRQKLFGELTRPVIVAAPCDHRIKPESMVRRANKMLGCGFRRRVWTIRLIG